MSKCLKERLPLSQGPAMASVAVMPWSWPGTVHESW